MPSKDIYKINNLTSAFTNTYNNTRYPACCLISAHTAPERSCKHAG